jgi:Na+-translocating ferredoxin:NAD+ oxidoreductase RnfG subunit
METWIPWALPAAAFVVAGTPVYAVQYLTVEQAQKLCFPQATEFKESDIIFTPQQLRSIAAQTGRPVETRGQQVWRVQAEGHDLGFFVVDYVVGKHLVIDYAVSLDRSGAVKQVEILQYRESYGGEIRSAAWRAQFAGKTVSSPFVINNDISNIGGATLSCRHVTEGVKKVLAVHDVCLR